MNRLLAVVKKEIRLLLRDIPGLIILFVMPLALIVAVSVTQQNAFSRMGQVKTPLLFASSDTGSFSAQLLSDLRKSGSFSVDTLPVTPDARTLAASQVASGAYQAAVFIPAGTSDAVTREMDEAVQGIFSGDTQARAAAPAAVTILLDPAITDAYRSSLANALRMMFQAAETKMFFAAYSRALPGALGQSLKPVVVEYLKEQLLLMEEEFTRGVKNSITGLPDDFRIKAPEREIDISLAPALQQALPPPAREGRGPVVELTEEYAAGAQAELRPSIIQNNVPAFGLFAMFFIVIPLAGSIITERKDGTLRRIRTLPVSIPTLLSGKVVVYTLICFLQMGLLLMAGRWLLPALFGLAPLETGNQWGAMLAAALCSSLAAIGFGMLVGVFSASQNQAGMFGSFMVVILGIFGGIFLPVYLMPEPLRAVSMLSPVRWGIDSFVDIFVRGASVAGIWPDLLRLAGFFVITAGITLLRYGKS